MIFEIKCNTCNNTFTVDSGIMSKKTGICCPNCEAKFSADAFSKIQTACTAFNDMAQAIQQQHIPNTGFPAFRVEIK